MAMVTEQRCDRCDKKIKRYGVGLEVQYHHPRKLDLCQECVGLFTLWLGKHPLWDTPLDQILAGTATGDGYPTKAQIAAYIEAQHDSNQ